MARTKPAARKNEEAKLSALLIRSLTLTPDTSETLERLSMDASDYIGRAVSGSAILRALLRYAAQQPYQWLLSDLSPLIEAELASGRMWGKKK